MNWGMGIKYFRGHSIKALIVRPAIGAHRVFMRPVIAALSLRPCHHDAHGKAIPSGAYYDQPISLTINISSKIYSMINDQPISLRLKMFVRRQHLLKDFKSYRKIEI